MSWEPDRYLQFADQRLRPALDLLNVALLAAVIGLFGLRQVQGAPGLSALEVGVLYAFVGYIARVVEPLIQITMQFSQLQQAMVGAARVHVLLKEAETPVAPDQGRVTAGGITIEQLRFAYQPGRPVLHGLDLRLASWTRRGYDTRECDPVRVQTRLLRVLSDGSFYRVGGHSAVKANVRVIAATHQDLEQRVREGGFREDLFHRLNVIRLRLPPLRERREDIALLTQALLARVAPQRSLSVAPKALALLAEQPFPGNVRELRNLLERTALLCDGDTIGEEHVQQALACGLPPLVSEVGEGAMEPRASAALTGSSRQRRLLDDEALQQALAAHQGSRAALARQLGISERSLYRRLKALGA